MSAEAGPEPTSDLDRVLLALYPSVVIEGRRGTARFDPQPEHRGNPGWLQGGLAATVLDHTCARVASAALGHRVVTATLDLRYPHPVALGLGPYRVEAEAAEPRGRLVRVTGGLLDGEGRALVQAKGLFVIRPDADGRSRD